MSYEIMSTTDTQNNQVISLSKAGNKYVLCYQAGEVVKNKRFDCLQVATHVYFQFVSAFATGYYSVEQRASWLD